MLHLRILKHADGQTEVVAADVEAVEADRQLGAHLGTKYGLSGDYDVIIDTWCAEIARDNGIELLEIELDFQKLFPDAVVLTAPSDAWNIMAETLCMDADSSYFDLAIRSDISEALKAVSHL
ncbi:MAG: hypothetical protein R6V19_04345 [Armatimonadota bacterium]